MSDDNQEIQPRNRQRTVKIMPDHDEQKVDPNMVRPDVVAQRLLEIRTPSRFNWGQTSVGDLTNAEYARFLGEDIYEDQREKVPQSANTVATRPLLDRARSWFTNMLPKFNSRQRHPV